MEPYEVIIHQKQETPAQCILHFLDHYFLVAADLPQIALSKKYFALFVFEVSLAE